MVDDLVDVTVVDVGVVDVDVLVVHALAGSGKGHMGSVILVVVCLKAAPAENMNTRAAMKASLFMTSVQSAD